MSAPAVTRLPYPVRRAWWELSVRSVLARRHLAGHRLDSWLPWWLWCRLCAVDGATVADALGRRWPVPLTFVQIGSNDGVHGDPLHRAVVEHHWRGVLVEPVPDLFERLVANYQGTSGVVFDNIAVNRCDGPMSLWTLEGRPGDPEWIDQLATFDHEILLRHCAEVPHLDSRIRHIRVDGLTLPSLIDKHGLEAVDLLHVDAEGFDLEVLSQVDVTARWAPRVVIFEKKHMDAADYGRAWDRFRRAGYRRVNLWPDEMWNRSLPRRAGSRFHHRVRTRPNAGAPSTA
jgi:FkbM family methyltransferase